ncbi:hypothetical protein NON00_14640 [Roseomonas sp. GC11]|uniref:hypothetical protein n=1 Tax=Roseomonas sp. GC11 TaxID=2950546 RepID=UPI00210CA6B8|nr:hypothetical protein [Roseomonas sp. GC11]MCQ4161160.1 hypothetical protein [Roseomonas sp. GC11]
MSQTPDTLARLRAEHPALAEALCRPGLTVEDALAIAQGAGLSLTAEEWALWQASPPLDDATLDQVAGGYTITIGNTQPGVRFAIFQPPGGSNPAWDIIQKGK